MVAPQTLRRLTREIVALSQSPPDGVRIAINESDILSFQAWIQGPPGTPYQQGHFQITFDFDGVDFPTVPPNCKFATPIFHPNVSRTGAICVSTLQKDWNPTYGIARILLTIKCLLIAPNPDSALDAEAARLLQEEYGSYAETARVWTAVYAARSPVGSEGPVRPAGVDGAAPPGGEGTARSKALGSVHEGDGDGARAGGKRVESGVGEKNVRMRATVDKGGKKASSTGPKRGVRRL